MDKLSSYPEVIFLARKTRANVRERTNLYVRMAPGKPRRGTLICGALQLRCALGRSGIGSAKREGDGATPLGRWRLRALWYRRDRVAVPHTRLSARAIRPDDGWCDAPSDRNYNRPVRLPYPARAEAMWREDHLYDLVVELGYNDRPRSRGRGSAVFMHLARADFAPTEGCIALERSDLTRLLQHCGPRTRLVITR